MTTSPERCADIVHDLLGTCKSLEEVCSDDEINDKVVTDAIDAEIFECDGCGWWCELSELNDDTGRWLCDDCSDEPDED